MYRNIVNTILVVSILFIYAAVFSQPKGMAVKHFTLRDGLPHEVCYEIYQDDIGTVWIGTDDGIAKFNGIGFDAYNTEDGLSNNYIIGFSRLHTDTTLIATWGGGINYLTKTEEMQPYPLFSASGKFNSIASGSDHVIAWNNSAVSWRMNQDGVISEKSDLLFIEKHAKKRFTNHFKRFADDGYQAIKNVNYAYLNKEGLVCYGEHIKGLWNYVNDSLVTPLYEKQLSAFPIFSLTQDKDSTLWLGTLGKFIHIDLEGKHQHVNIPKSDEAVIDIKRRGKHQLLIITREKQYHSKSIYLYNLFSKQFISLSDFIDSTATLAYAFIDRDENVWISTDGKGVYLFQPNPFNTYNNEDGLGNSFIFDIKEDRDGKVWVGTKKGIYYFDGTQFNSPSSQLKEQVNLIWINPSGGFFVNSKAVYSFLENQFNKIELDDSPSNRLIANEGLYYKDDLLYTFNSNLITEFKRNSKDKTFFKNNYLYFPKALDIEKSQHIRDDEFWLATAQGLLHYKHQKGKGVFLDSINQADGLQHPAVNDFIRSSADECWIATEGGLCHKSTKGVTCITVEDGLLSNKCRALAIDHQGNIWIGTPKGLSRFDGENIVSFNQESGLLANAVNCLFIDSKKQLWVGSSQGISVLPLDEETYIQKAPEIKLKTLELNGETVPFKNDMEVAHGSSLRFQLSFTKQFTLNTTIQYQYNNQTWKTLNNNSLELLNPNQGGYVLRFRSKKINSPWSEVHTIQFKVLPPLWKSWQAILGYALISLIILGLTIRYIFNKQAKKTQEHITQMELIQLKKLNDFKSRFFDNISHEFRTPLTLILGSLDNLLAAPRPEDEDSLRVSKRNATVLLELINQLLALSKVESDKLTLERKQYNLIAELHRLCESFETIAGQQLITFSTEFSDESLSFGFDQSKIRIIVSNLLSNAMKFTNEGGFVKLQVFKANPDPASPVVVIKVIDNGVGIAQNELPYIFDRFHQAGNAKQSNYEGSGIGLALVKELVELHQGEIDVQSELGHGTDFTIKLPFVQMESDSSAVVLPQEEKADTLDLFVPQQQEEQDIPQLLIVDDNKDMCWYIHSLLSSDYQINIAHDGEEGLKMAKSLLPDLIISDVMMPKMSGTALCQHLKSDEATSHIPIVLLTAKAGQQNKLTGLRLGADEYLTKPFDRQELKLRLQNLFTLRKRMQDAFSKTLDVQAAKVTTTPTDQLFLERAISVVEQHLHNSNFKSADFVKEMAMSRTLLHNKLKCITNQSTSEFIRNLRLKRAAQLIQQNQESLSDICYQVGFNSMSYFSSSFSKLFDKSPSEYQEKFVKID